MEHIVIQNWIENHCKISDPIGNTRPAILNDFQKELIKVFSQNQNVIFSKPRKTGTTQLAKWYLEYQKKVNNKKIGVFANDKISFHHLVTQGIVSKVVTNAEQLRGWDFDIFVCDECLFSNELDKVIQSFILPILNGRKQIIMYSSPNDRNYTELCSLVTTKYHSLNINGETYIKHFIMNDILN